MKCKEMVVDLLQNRMIQIVMVFGSQVEIDYSSIAVEQIHDLSIFQHIPPFKLLFHLLERSYPKDIVSTAL